jgi:hypothetical protein
MKLKIHPQMQLHSPIAKLATRSHIFYGATWLCNNFRWQLGRPKWWPNNCGYETGCEA